MNRENAIVMSSGVELADFYQSLCYDNLPKEVVHQAKRAILDCVATMILGSRQPPAYRITGILGSEESIDGCTVIGTALRSSCGWSAFANAAFSQIFDYNDGYGETALFGGSLHPGRVIIPVCLAVSEWRESSGRQMLSALIAGYETAMRIRGISPAPVSDCYGGAASAAILLGGERITALHALGIASCFSPRNFPERAGEYDTDFLRNGYKAKVSVEAAVMAAEGFSGPPVEDDPALSLRFKKRGLGKEYLIMGIYFKPYPTCRVTHGALDILLRLRKESIIDPGSIQRITIRIAPRNRYVMNFTVRPDSYYKTAQFSMAYVAASALVYGEIGEPQFSQQSISNPKVHEMMGKIEISADESMESESPRGRSAVKVEIWKTNNERLEDTLVFPRGDPENPLSDHELSEKLLLCNKGKFPDAEINRIRESIMHIEDFENVKSFMKL
ncbi:MAG TPA: MmgE/PrpD family protein, partial [Spirochaetia bacterium]|nr:MmgE/PrpD family protein [Spirochaetia bacterium]